MKTMMNFAAQQLSNNAMQSIRGGVVGGNNGNVYIVNVYNEYGIFINSIRVTGAANSTEAGTLVLKLYGRGFYAVAGRVVE